MENVPRETSQENPSFEGFSGIKKLDLKDYFIRGIEITMEYFHFQSDLVYDFNKIYLEILNTFLKKYY